MTADDLPGGNELFSQQARYDGFSHHATADESESRARQRGGSLILSLFRFWHIPVHAPGAGFWS